MANRNRADDVTDIILEVFRLNGCLIESGNALVKDLDLTSARWQVIGALNLKGEPMTVPDIARSMGLTRQSVQRLVNELSEKGVVAFEKNIRHKRSKNVVLTDKGKKLHDETLKRQIPWANNLGLGITRKDLLTTFQVLNKMRSVLEEE